MNFNGLAPVYPWMECLLAGKLMQRCRSAYLPLPGQPRRALLAGEGTGKFLVALLKCNPTLEITCVEQSQRMIAQMRRRLLYHGLEAGRVDFVNADFLNWLAPAETFDVLATHFFLDCFDETQLAGVINKLTAVAHAETVWLLSDFQIPSRGWRRWRARIIIGTLYQFFRLTTNLSARKLVSPDAMMQRAGFELAQRQYFSLGLTHTDLWRKAKSRAEK